MTDEKPNPTVRCRACGTVYPNTALDKGYHRANCPYDLRLRIQALEELLKERVAAIVPPEEVPWDDDSDVAPDDQADFEDYADVNVEDEDEPLPAVRPLTI